MGAYLRSPLVLISTLFLRLNNSRSNGFNLVTLKVKRLKLNAQNSCAHVSRSRNGEQGKCFTPKNAFWRDARLGG